MKRLFSSLVVVGAAVLGLAIPAAQAQEEPSEALRQLRLGKPAPDPQGPAFSVSESRAPERRDVVGYDPATGKVEVVPRAEMRALAEPLGESDPPNVGDAPLAMADTQAGRAPSITPTPPAPYSVTTNFPFNTIFKMLMRFNVSGTDYYYVCSGWAAGDFHIVTAGHCVYNWDPNDDGSTADARWADEVWVWPAQTDRVAPFGGDFLAPDAPYGPAKMVFERSYSGWTTGQDHNHDWAVVTLDRRLGARTGWMGRESSVTDNMNFSGYPAEQPYVPADTHVQYYGYDAGNVSSSDDYRIYLDAYVYGGHSGGPSWRYDGATTNRYVEGIHSTSDRVGSAADTRLTDGKRSDLDSYMTTDETQRPPVERPEITEYLFDGSAHKGFSPTSGGRGASVTIDYGLLNAGWVGTGNVTVSFYASPNKIVSHVDTLLGSTVIGSIDPWSYFLGSGQVTIPSGLAAGSYYLGWIASSTTAEYSGDITCTDLPCSNHGVISSPTLTVQDCSLDGYESDNSSGSASTLGTMQSHSICSIGDVDWARFTLTAESLVTLETSGASGDSELWLYNSGLGQVDYDDDDGSGLFSRIDHLLGPGTYYVKVGEYGSNSYIQSYALTRTTVPTLIFQNGFETGLAPWSSWVP